MNRNPPSPFPRLGRLHLAHALALLFLLAGGAYLFRTMQTMKDHLSGVAHSHAVLWGISSVDSILKDAETSMRGFLLTQNRDFLAPYFRARAQADGELAHLARLVQANPEQTRLFGTLRTAMRERLAVIAEQIRDAENGFPHKYDLIEKGRVPMDLFREVSDTMAADERAILSRKQAAAHEITALMDRAFLSSTLLNIVLVSAAVLVLQRFLRHQARENWIAGIQGQIALELGQTTNMVEHGRTLLENLARQLNAKVGTLYVEKDGDLWLEAAFGASGTFSPPNTLAFREGLTGRAAAERRVLELTHVPATYLEVSSSVGREKATHVLNVPIVTQGKVMAVMEFGGFENFHPFHGELFERLSEYLGTEIKAFLARRQVAQLLTETQEQARQLQVQQEELRMINEELTQQTDLLKRSETQLEEQHTELEEINSRIEMQNQELKAERARVHTAYQQLQESQQELVAKATALEQASRYKSEFLANMSHELRTPLNSILILGQLFAENRTGSLSEEQTESARTIVSAGHDLLALINDVLDLSKIEAGRLELSVEEVPLDDLLGKLTREFAPLAERNGLAFVTDKAGDLPDVLQTDRQRLDQVLRNFLSNALKFTESGQVRISVRRPPQDMAERMSLPAPHQMLAFSVEDTGIGIPRDKHGIIFEAFKQADGTTSRRFGGTGLGLSIARELARLLGGAIDLVSEEGRGSSFTLVIPESAPGIMGAETMARPAVKLATSPERKEKPTPRSATARDLPRPAGFDDDRAALTPSDRIIQIVEDEPEFASTLRSLARQHDFKCILSPNGEEALKDALTHHPHGILLDLKLPGMGGMEVLNQLKARAETRHIPVQIISGVDLHAAAYQHGAIGYLVKPVLPDQIRTALDRVAGYSERRVAKLLLVEDDPSQRRAMRELLGGQEIEVIEAASGEKAQEFLRTQTFDCMVLDLRLPDVEGLRLLELMAADEGMSHPPVIVYTGKPLSVEEEERLLRHSESIIIKGARSPERLLEQTTLFLHQVESELPEEKRSKLRLARNDQKWLEGRTVLLTDDDMRNVYAISRVLEERGAHMEIARNGQEAVDKIATGTSVDVVLMDVMMPVMDGFEATRRIRAMQRHLPIIMLTAKAMAQDRDRSFEVGANDYLTKPVDVNRLLSVLRVWISGRGF